MLDVDPFHEGEHAVQRAAGEEAGARQNGGMIDDRVMPGARQFLRARPMLIATSRDASGDFWASALFGIPGFVTVSDDGQAVTIDRSMLSPANGDPFWDNLSPGAQIGFLAIDLSTRHRLRVNGKVVYVSDDRLHVDVVEAYPNCPKYVQLRALVPRLETVDDSLQARGGVVPDPALVAAIRRADTCFVASGHPTRGLDASHRGGNPGFITFIDDRTIRVPDYLGNSMFNTLGNFAVDARCGLTVLDFEAEQLHQMTGEAVARFGTRQQGDPAACTGRYWDFKIRLWKSSAVPVQADQRSVAYSPYNPTNAHRSDANAND